MILHIKSSVNETFHLALELELSFRAPLDGGSFSRIESSILNVWDMDTMLTNVLQSSVLSKTNSNIIFTVPLKSQRINIMPTNNVDETSVMVISTIFMKILVMLWIS